jgi:flagellar assembly factor FliW
MAIKTGRFGVLNLSDEDPIQMTQGILGFPDSKRFCVVDSGESLILWFQSFEESGIAFPVIEPRLFKPDYRFRLSNAELKELGLSNLSDAVVLTILTVPESIQDMSANLKAPLVLNPEARLGKQVVLQENEYPVRFPMFHALRAAFLPFADQAQDIREPKVIPIRQLRSPVQRDHL